MVGGYLCNLCEETVDDPVWHHDEPYHQACTGERWVIKHEAKFDTYWNVEQAKWVDESAATEFYSPRKLLPEHGINFRTEPTCFGMELEYPDN